MSSIPNTNATNATTKLAQFGLRLDAGYKGDETSKRVADILNLPSMEGWKVEDSDDSLAMIHYDETADMKSVLSTHRGTIVDKVTGTIIKDSFGSTPIAVADELAEKDGQLSIIDKAGDVHVFTQGDYVIKRVFEGVVIRIVRHNGKVYRMSHKKLNITRSRWGSAKTFLTMYEEAGGPKDEELFDLSKPFSCTCYEFLVSDPSLCVGTRQQVAKPYLVLLNKNYFDVKQPAELVAPGILDCSKFLTEIPAASDAPYTHDPQPLSLEEANQHLRSGYYNDSPLENKDKRQSTGEAVIVYRMYNVEHPNGSIESVVEDVVKVHSEAFDWRVNMRGNNPNPAHQFYALLDKVFCKGDSEKHYEEFFANFIKDFIPFPVYTETSIKELFNANGVLLYIPQEGALSKDHYRNRDDRILVLWINYLFSLPPSLQKSALDLYTNFKTDRAALIKWFQEIEPQVFKMEEWGFSRRAADLIATARSMAKEAMRTGQNYTSNGRYQTLAEVIRSKFFNLLNKERGTSSYALIREMKQFQNPENPQVPIKKTAFRPAAKSAQPLM